MLFITLGFSYDLSQFSLLVPILSSKYISIWIDSSFADNVASWSIKKVRVNLEISFCRQLNENAWMYLEYVQVIILFCNSNVIFKLH